jgi:tetratricopeptide (TPR) repeat protein
MTVRRLLTLLTLAVSASSVGFSQSFDDVLKKGRAQVDSGKGDDAVSTLERAVQLNPKSAEAHFQLGRALGTVAQRANILRQPMLARRVKSEFEKAAELAPEMVAPREGLIQFYLQAPGVMGGSVPKAREQAAAIARVNALRGHFAEASIANHEKDPVGAERAFRAAATAFPDSLNAVTALANFLAGLGKGDDAFGVLDKYLAKHPADRVAQFYVGRTAATTGKQLDRGEQALRTLLAVPASDSGPRVAPETIRYRLGDIAAQRGDKAKARAEYEAALKINPKLEQARRALAAL